MVFRRNDAAVVGELRSALLDGQNDDAFELLREFWTNVGEIHDASDPLEAEVWSHLEKQGLAHRGVVLGLTLIRARERIRPRSFTRIIEDIDRAGNPELPSNASLDGPRDLSEDRAKELVELAEIALSEEWPGDPYTAAILLKLADGQMKRTMWPFIKERRVQLENDPGSWTALCYLALTTSLPLELGELCAGITTRNDVPAWLLGAYQIEVGGGPSTLWDACLPDDPARPTLEWLSRMGQAVRNGRIDEFFAISEEHADWFEFEPDQLKHPLFRYPLTLRRGQAVSQADLDFKPNNDPLVTARKGIRFNQRLVDASRELSPTRSEYLAWRSFRELATTSDQGELLALWRRYRKGQNLYANWMKQAFEGEMRKKTTLGTRIKYAIFG